MFLVLLASSFLLLVQAVHPRFVEDPQGQYVPYEHTGDVYLGSYLLSPSQAQIVREIYYVTPRVLMDNDYRRVIAEASDPRQLYSSIVKKSRAIEEELPIMQKFIQDSVAFVENNYGKAEDIVDDPVIFFENLGPKLFMAVKSMEIDGLLRASFKKLGVPNNKTYIDIYAMVLQNPLRLRTQDGQRIIEEALGLCSGTVQRLKLFLYEDTSIYYTFRRYMAKYIGHDESGAKELIQEILRHLRYDKLLQKALDDHKVTFFDVVQELKKMIQMDRPDGKVSFGSGAAAEAVKFIMAEIQRIESGFFVEDPMQQIITKKLY